METVMKNNIETLRVKFNKELNLLISKYPNVFGDPDEFYKISTSLDMAKINKLFQENKRELQKYLNQKICTFHEEKQDKKTHMQVIFNMICYALFDNKNPNLLDDKKYKFETEFAIESNVADGICSIIWVIDRKTNEKVFVAKPGMRRSENDAFLNRFFEHLKEQKLIPKEMENIFIPSSPAVIDISQIEFPKLKNNNTCSSLEGPRFIYDLENDAEAEVSLNDNKKTHGLLLVGVQTRLQPCSENDIKEWVRNNPLNFLLTIGILKMINARDIKQSSIMMMGKQPVIIDAEEFLQEKKTLDGFELPPIHIPFIKIIKNEKIPSNIVKQVNQYFKKWKKSKKALNEFIQQEQRIFVERHESIQSDGQIMTDLSSFNLSNCNLFSLEDAFFENESTEDGQIITDPSDMIVKIYSSSNNSSELVDETNILSQTQQMLLMDNICNMSQVFETFSDEDEPKTVLQIMQFIDLEWFKDYKAFDMIPDDDCALKRSGLFPCDLTGICSPKSNQVRREQKTYTVDDDDLLSTNEDNEAIACFSKS